MCDTDLDTLGVLGVIFAAPDSDLKLGVCLGDHDRSVMMLDLRQDCPASSDSDFIIIKLHGWISGTGAGGNVGRLEQADESGNGYNVTRPRTLAFI